MNIIDTHCHYNLEPLFSESQGWEHVWQEAQAAGVQKSIVVGTSLETTQHALEIAALSPRLFATAGIHPGEVTEFCKQDSTASELQQVISTQLEQLESTLQKATKKPVAIGELGLDYFHYQKQYSTSREWQTWKTAQHVLAAAQLTLANKLQLPALLHVRSVDDTAYWDMLALLEQAQLSTPFVLHCASGPLSYISKALALGAYVSVAGNVTYKNADNIRAIVQVTPADRLLVETDAPYLPPHPYRGQTCRPAMIQLTVAYLEKELSIDPAQLVKNAETLFSI